MDKVRSVRDALEDKKGLNITVLDLSRVSDITDCFVICSGTNKSQIQALCFPGFQLPDPFFLKDTSSSQS